MDSLNKRVEELKFGKQMDKALDKKTLIRTVIKAKPKRVLDLGAGTGIISKGISEANIFVDAVDNCFKTDLLINTEFLTYHPVNIFTFLKHTSNKYDCIILSALLHELNPFEILKLKRLLKRVIDKEDCTIIIREPYYEKTKECIKPFISKDAQKKFKELMITLTPEKTIRKFFRKPKLSWLTVPKCIKYLNLAFTVSYGEQSWKREVKEYKYAYSKKYLERFCKSIIPEAVTIITQNYDKNYKQFFIECGYTEEVYSSFEWTNCTLIAKGKPFQKSKKKKESQEGE